MILEFKLDDWTVIKNIFININEIIDEIAVLCDDDGLKFTGIDRGHVCFFECVISKDLFDEYSVSEILYLYLDLNELVRVLKRGSGKDSLVFEGDVEKINVIFKNKNTRTFQITQLDDIIDSKEPPTLEYSISFNCNFDTIKSSLKDADLYSDRLKFDCEDDLLVLTCDSGFGKYKNEYSLDESVDDYCSAIYSIDWLMKIFNNKLGSDNLKIHMGQDFPMLIEMSLDNVIINYLLAPRLGE